MAVAQGTIRAAIVGYGVSGGVFHGPLLAADPEYVVAAVVTGRADRIAAARRRFPDAVVCRDYAALLELMDNGALELDLLIIGTPPALHREQAVAAAERGLHVVVDKPFAPTVKDAEAMIEAADARGTVLTVFQNRRWDADFLTLAALVREGRLGYVRTFESRFEWWRPQGFGSWRDTVAVDEGGGLLLDLGSHLVDQAIQLFGPVRRARADLRRHSSPTGSDEDSFAELQHENGTVSRLWMNGLAPALGPRFHVLGSAAGFTSWGLDGQEAALAAGTDPLAACTPDPKAAGLLIQGDSTERIPYEQGDYPAFYRLLAARLTGDGRLPVEPADAVETLRILRDLHETTQIHYTARS